MVSATLGGVEGVDLDAVVDDEVARDEGADLGGSGWVAGHADDGLAHGGEIDDGRHASKVLEDDAARHEGDLDLTDSGRVVGGELLDVLLADDVAVEVAQAGLEEDADAVRDRAEISEGVEAVDGAPTEGGVDGVLGVEGVAVRGRHGRGGV
jgi:hypothetical protein